MGRKKDTLQQRSAKMTNRRRVRYDKSDAFIELFNPKYHPMLRFGKNGLELKSLLKNGDYVDIQTVSFLDFRLTADPEDDRPCCTHKQIYQWLAKILVVTGSKGTRYGKNMIFRYIANGHSNYSLGESTLKSSVNKEISKILLTEI